MQLQCWLLLSVLLLVLLSVLLSVLLLVLLLSVLLLVLLSVLLLVLLSVLLLILLSVLLVALVVEELMARQQHRIAVVVVLARCQALPHHHASGACERVCQLRALAQTQQGQQC